jgi:hypothetical protein
MHEKFRKRLEALEEFYKLQDGPLHVRHINFVRADGHEVDATLAKGPGNFVCRRAMGEELIDFKARASDECLALKPRVPCAILLFMREASDAA